MTIQILIGDNIRSQVLNILSGECFFQRQPYRPELFILSPWVTDVEVEFSDLYVLREKEKLVRKEKFESFLFDYNIKSINLPYALLLLKLHNGVEVNIVTLPLEEMNLNPNYLPKVKILLDFLDEIGCNMFVNSKLHSKLLLANDLALLGSFNLTSSALYYKEEIGISVNDIDNLKKLESYCMNVVSGSQPYGYSSLVRYGHSRDMKCVAPDYVEGMSEENHKELLRKEREHRNHITRGFFLDYMILHTVYHGMERSERYGEFFNVTGGYDKFIKSYSSDLNLFYLMNLRRLISSPEGKDCATSFFNYKGDKSTDSIMELVNNKFARKSVPDITLRVESLE